MGWDKSIYSFTLSREKTTGRDEYFRKNSLEKVQSKFFKSSSPLTYYFPNVCSLQEYTSLQLFQTASHVQSWSCNLSDYTLISDTDVPTPPQSANILPKVPASLNFTSSFRLMQPTCSSPYHTQTSNQASQLTTLAVRKTRSTCFNCQAIFKYVSSSEHFFQWVLDDHLTDKQ